MRCAATRVGTDQQLESSIGLALLSSHTFLHFRLHGPPEAISTAGHRFDEVTKLGNAETGEVGRSLNNRVENSHIDKIG